MTDQKPVRYWFAVKVTFICPVCKKPNEEVMYMSAGKPDPGPIAAATQTQNLKCKFCKTPLKDGTQVNVNVLPVTLEQAKAAGFNPPPGSV
jgi:hypothetical protein